MKVNEIRLGRASYFGPYNWILYIVFQNFIKRAYFLWILSWWYRPSSLSDFPLEYKLLKGLYVVQFCLETYWLACLVPRHPRDIKSGGAQAVMGRTLLNHRPGRLKNLLTMEEGLHHLETPPFSREKATFIFRAVSPIFDTSSLSHSHHTPRTSYSYPLVVKQATPTLSWYLQGSFSKPTMSTPVIFIWEPQRDPNPLKKIKSCFDVSVHIDFLTNFTGHWGVFKSSLQIIFEVQDITFLFQQFIQNWGMKRSKNYQFVTLRHISMNSIVSPSIAYTCLWSGFLSPLFYYNNFFKG